MTIFALAETLHQPISEVMSWTLDEVRGWVAYFNIQAEKRNQK